MTHAASNVVPLHADGDGDLVLIAPGDYLAMYVGHRTFEIFRHMKLRVDFRLIEYTQPVTLSRWYRVRDCRGGRISASRSSDLVRELEAELVLLPRSRRLLIATSPFACAP